MINNEIDYYVHPSAIIDTGAQIGVGTRIWHWTHICQTAKIGIECTIGQNVYVADRVCIGDRVKIQNNVSIYEGVTLEDDVFCGPSMVFTNVINPRSFINRKQDFKPTLVKRGATIGANVTVVCGNTIGRYALVGAGSVIIKNVADHALVVGNPARHIGWVCYCGTTLPNQQGQVSCTACQQSYRVARGGISTILSSYL